MGLFLINASVTKGEREEENLHSPRCWKLLLHLHLWEHKVTHNYMIIQTYSSYIHAPFLQVLIEATVSRERRGYIAIDDIMVLNYPCCKCHFWLWLHKVLYKRGI